MESEDNYQKQYVKPVTELFPLNAEAYTYLKSRGLSKKTVDLYKVGLNKYGNIAIPFYDERGELGLIKFRAATGGMITMQKRSRETGQMEQYEVKSFCEPKGRPILLGSHMARMKAVDDATLPLIICYGDYDAMAVTEAGFANATSLPFGDRGHGFIDEQWDFINQFEKIILVPDLDTDPKTRKQFFQKFEELAKRLGKYRCCTTDEHLMKGCKDVNELLIKHGKDAVKQLLSTVYYLHEEGLERLSDYKDEKYEEGFPTGWTAIDKATGGIGKGLMSVWSGDNNAGKTTIVLKLLASAMKERIPSFYWSGEQKPSRIRWWFEQIVAGPNFVVNDVSPRTGRTYWFANPDHIKKIREWYGPLLWVYDKRGISPEDFFAVAELAVRRHGAQLIVVDNLMAFTGGEDDYFAAQGRFAESCKNFAEDWNVHVALIAHNKKLNEMRVGTKDDIEGSKKITNWADEVYQVFRVPKSMRKEEFEGVDTVLSLCKNRESEELVDVRMIFEHRSKRIVQMTEPEKTEELLGWEGDINTNLYSDEDIMI